MLASSKTWAHFRDLDSLGDTSRGSAFSCQRSAAGGAPRATPRGGGGAGVADIANMFNGVAKAAEKFGNLVTSPLRD